MNRAIVQATTGVKFETATLFDVIVGKDLTADVPWNTVIGFARRGLITPVIDARNEDGSSAGTVDLHQWM